MSSPPEKRILLVDDDTVFTDVMARSLRRRDFIVRTSAGAAEALAACRDFIPSHIVLDLNMPDTSGLVALPALLEAAPDARIVVLTGYSSIATAVAATKAGACNYLCKPATVDQVLEAFETVAQAPAEIPTEPISVERLEWEHIQRVLQGNEGNVSATARALGMHRRTLQRKLQKRPVRK